MTDNTEVPTYSFCLGLRANSWTIAIRSVLGFRNGTPISKQSATVGRAA